ncbi:diaminobutyrate--2-oxoglutarate transaminase [Streptomyces sp. NPDC023998]|uniref:diaminobutyrate--2-oxoglutarate transaminase n=1 Tax=Streptomyces sp. NPDC023998 TaxID=3154597 RepID=UPI0033FB3CAE
MSIARSDSSIFETVESEVRSYCRSWPVVFDRARGSHMYDEWGRPYLDFFTGAGTLNYGHNNPVLKRALLDYLGRDGVTHALDMSTVAKRAFLGAFRDTILLPRGMDHKVMFTGPTGTNAVEAALKLARKVTGRKDIIYFTNAFHGVSLGSLAVTANAVKRAGAGIPLVNSTEMAFDNGLSDEAPRLLGLERLLDDRGPGPARPAAVIVETVQGEGGVHVARIEWLRDLASLCKRHGMLLIIDDIQMGCGRTGDFFSFERAGIIPDVITLSKAVSGYGLPLALTLFKPELDVWKPGEHNGTFRGNNPAFVTATAALQTYWTDGQLEKQVLLRSEQIEVAFRAITAHRPDVSYRGCGLVWGLDFQNRNVASKVAERSFELGLLVETVGPDDEVVKLLPPLTITPEELGEGLSILGRAVHEAGTASEDSLPI